MGNDQGFGTYFDTDCLGVWTEIQSFIRYCMLWQYQLWSFKSWFTKSRLVTFRLRMNALNGKLHSLLKWSDGIYFEIFYLVKTYPKKIWLDFFTKRTIFIIGISHISHAQKKLFCKD